MLMANNLECILPSKVCTFLVGFVWFQEWFMLRNFCVFTDIHTYQLILTDSYKSTIMTGIVDNYEGFGFSKVLVDDDFVS